LNHHLKQIQQPFSSTDLIQPEDKSIPFFFQAAGNKGNNFKRIQSPYAERQEKKAVEVQNAFDNGIMKSNNVV